jgi:hypothetical protein
MNCPPEQSEGHRGDESHTAAIDRVVHELPTTTIGRVRFPAVGTHQIRLQVVGQNAASSAFILSADRFILRR